MVLCCVVGCKSRSDESDPRIKFHPFSRHHAHRWVQILFEIRAVRENFNLKDQTRICSKHFHPQSYETKENGKRGFRPSAVPEIFSEETRKRFPKHPPLSVSGKRAIRRPAKYGASHKRVGSSRVRVPQDRLPSGMAIKDEPDSEPDFGDEDDEEMNEEAVKTEVYESVLKDEMEMKLFRKPDENFQGMGDGPPVDGRYNCFFFNGNGDKVTISYQLEGCSPEETPVPKPKAPFKILTSEGFEELKGTRKRGRKPGGGRSGANAIQFIKKQLASDGSPAVATDDYDMNAETVNRLLTDTNHAKNLYEVENENKELKHFARKCMAYCETLAVNNKKLNQRLTTEQEQRKKERDNNKRMTTRVPPLWQMEGTKMEGKQDVVKVEGPVRGMAWKKDVVASAKLIRDKIGSKAYQDLIKQGFPLPSDKVLQTSCGSSRRDARNATIKDHYEKLNQPDPVKASISIKGPAEAGTTLATPLGAVQMPVTATGHHEVTTVIAHPTGTTHEIKVGDQPIAVHVTDATGEHGEAIQTFEVIDQPKEEIVTAINLSNSQVFQVAGDNGAPVTLYYTQPF